MSAPRIMTVEEANALVPHLSDVVGRQLERAHAIEEKLDELRALSPAPTGGRGALALEPGSADTTTIRELKTTLLAMVAEYESGWREVQDLGAMVKDVRMGLVDFYGRIDDKVVLLCWRHGEEAIRYYHDLDAGFSGRKALDEQTRKRALN